MVTLTDIWTFVAGPFLGGLIALWSFLKLAPAVFLERGFGHYLDRKMAVIKLENDGKLETLRSDLKHLDDRGVRSNEREYEALRSTWDLFVTAFYATRRAAGGFRRIPVFSNMTSDQVMRALEVTDFTDQQKQHIIDSDDRHQAFSRIAQATEINEAGSALSAARDILRRQSVFIPKDINQRFEKEIAWLQLAYSERVVKFEYEGSRIDPKTTVELLTEYGETVFDEVRSMVRERLLRSDKL